MITLESLAARPQEPLAQPAYDRWCSPDGEVATLFHRTPDGYLVRFPERADFAITAEGSHVRCTPTPDTDEATVRDLYLNQVVPLIQSARGEIVLHASAVATPLGVLGFVGPTGRGKSTLAAAFARRGHGFLTDDGLLLNRVGADYMARPNRAYMRLRPDSEAVIFARPIPDGGEDDDKRQIGSGPGLPHHDQPMPLHALYFVTAMGAADISLTDALAPGAALREFIQHSFILDVEDRPRVSALFSRLADLAETISCFHLDYPRRYAMLDSVVDAILDHARTGVCTK